MSGSGGDGDDLDEVTLWAGRLRAWPAAPASDAEGDETVRSPRRASPVGDPTPAVDAEGDETARSPRLESNGGDATRALDAGGDETVRSPRSASDRGDATDRGPVDSEALPDGDTAPRRAGRSRAVDRDGGDTAAAVTAPAGPARPAPVVNDSALAVTAPDPALDASADDAAVDDATAAAGRPRVASDPVVETAVSGQGREARAPTALQRETYAPRRDAPVRVTRRAAASAPGARDAATVSPRRSRGGARLLVFAAAIVGVLALAAVGVVLLLV